MKILTLRENEIANLVAEGKRNREIVNELCISFHTVKIILENIYAKLELKNRLLLAVFVVKTKK